MRLLLGAGLILVVLTAAPAARADPPSASFRVDPAVPQSGQVVTFTSTATGTVTDQSWDLDGDGRCDDATGGTATRTFQAPGTYRIGLCVSGPDGDATATRPVTVVDVPPVASFEVRPLAPRVGQRVTFISTSTDPDSGLAAYDWDLDGDGVFDDAQGVAVTWTFDRAQAVVAGLRVTDAFGLSAVATAPLSVAPAPLVPMSPPPVVRLSGRYTYGGMVVSRLAVRAPAGAFVDVRCHPRRLGCRFKHLVRRSKGKAWRVARAQRPLSAGAVIAIRVRRPGTIGRYVRIRIRAGRPPERVDRCLGPKPAKPRRCA